MNELRPASAPLRWRLRGGVRPLGGRGFDAVDLGGFDGLGNFLLQGLDFGELAGLVEDDLVELVVLMLQMGEAGFQLFEALSKFLVHLRCVFLPDSGSSPDIWITSKIS